MTHALVVPERELHAVDAAASLVDVIVVNWNAGAQLAACLASIAQHGGATVRRTVVVDNNSTDGSADVMMPGMALEVIKSARNLGFGRACNLAARRTDAPYILFLNPDAELHDDAVDRALAHIQAPGNERVGVVGIRLQGRDGVAHRHCARFPTWHNFIGNSFGLTRIARRWFPPILMSDFDHLSNRCVDHVMGAFYLIRRSVFEALDGFDERFFVYLEDLDLSLRVHEAGYAIMYLAEAEAYHRQGGTSEQVKARRLFYSLHSGIIYAFKHFSRPAALAVALVTYLIEPFSRSARAVFRRSGRELVFTWQGFAMLYRATPALLTTIRAMKRDESE